MHFDQGVLSKHLAFGIQQYVIPEFQRPYSWREEDWRTLWVDILRQYREVHSVWKLTEDQDDRQQQLQSRPTHYLGTLVTADPVTVSPPRSKVIDGQQRMLTSMTLLLAVRDYGIRRLGRGAKNAPKIDARKSKFAPYLSNVGHEGRDQWRIVPQQIDQRAYEHLLNPDREIGRVKLDEVGMQPSDSPQLLKAFNFFLREMSRRSLSANPPFEMLNFGEFYPLEPDILEQVILNRLYLIKLVAESSDDPNMIFESLNAKGRDLQQVDLIKNFLYLSLRGSASEVYRLKWRPMELVLRPEEMEKFAWASLVSHGENVLQKRTYEAVQRNLREKPVDAVKAYVDELSKEAIYYERILRPENEKNGAVQSALKKVLAAGGSTAQPLLVYCYRQLRTEQCSTADFCDAMEVIEGFLVRRMIAGKATNNLNSMFGSVCSRLHNDARYRATGALPDDLSRALGSLAVDEWPDDEVVLIGIRQGDFYGSQKTEQRLHVLRSIDGHFNTTGVQLHYEQSDRSIEHIAPQDDDAEEWVDKLSADAWEEIQRRVHALCNLTLLTPHDNSSLGAHGWAHKWQRFEKYPYPMTARLAELFDQDGGWTPDRMNQRADDLLSAVNALWPKSTVPPHTAPMPERPSVGSEPAEGLDDDAHDGGESLDVDAPASLLDLEK